MRPLFPPPPIDLASGETRGSKQTRRGRRGGTNNRCDECGETWGPGVAHCGGDNGCHETFTSLLAFDLHRHEGWCRNPGRVDGLFSDNGSWRV